LIPFGYPLGHKGFSLDPPVILLMRRDLMGITDKLPLLNNKSKIVKMVGYVLYAFVILMIIGAMAPAPSAKDYSTQENVAENLLLDLDFDLGLDSAEVSIDTQEVTFNCITNHKDAPDALGQFGHFVTGALVVYSSLVDSTPEVGDLMIVAQEANQPTVTTMTCSKSRIKEVDTTSEDAMSELMAQVILTMKKVPA
jgi:hypothetical protein